jgi:multicomponent Na+:H+ antiporter subunit F
MNLWLMSAAAVSTALVPCADMCFRGSPERRLVGFEFAGILVVIAMILFTVGFGRTALIDLPVALALLSFGGVLVFARFLGKHL